MSAGIEKFKLYNRNIEKLNEEASTFVSNAVTILALGRNFLVDIISSGKTFIIVAIRP